MKTLKQKQKEYMRRITKKRNPNWCKDFLGTWK